MQHMPMLRFIIVLLPNSFLGIEPEWEAMDPQKSSSIEKKEESGEDWTEENQIRLYHIA